MEVTSDPAFSVIVPVFNGAGTVGATLRSVLAQTRDDFEVVVVDDGSTDDSVERVDPFLSDPRIRLVQQENRGLAGARNAGVAVARAPLVCLLDSDDLWMPGFLAGMGALLARRPEVAFATCDAWLLDDHNGRVRRQTALDYQRAPASFPSTSADLLRALVAGNIVYGGAVIRRTALQRVGGFDAALRASEDLDLWLRLALEGMTGVRHPDRLAIYRLRAASLSRQPDVMDRSLRDVYRKVEHCHGADPQARALAAAGAAACERRLAIRARPVLGPGARVIATSRQRFGAFRQRAVAARTWHADPPAPVAAVLAATAD